LIPDEGDQWKKPFFAKERRTERHSVLYDLERARDKEVALLSLLRQGKAQILTIYLGESDQWQGMPLYVAIIQFLRDHGCAGATATRAVVGYGAGARLHESGGLRWSSDASMVIQVVDQPDRLRRLLPQLQEMLNGGLMTLHDVDVLKYTHAQRRGLPAKLPVRQVMETLVTTVEPDTPVASVVDVLLNAPFRALPVVDHERRLQGIISTGDLITSGLLPVRRGLARAALELGTLTAEAIETPLAQAQQSIHTAQDIMNRQVRTIRPDQSIREAAAIMVETGLRRLPVVEADGTLAGMLTRADLLGVVVTSPLMSPHASSATQPLRHTGSLSQEASVPTQQRPVAEYLQLDVAAVGEEAPLAEVIDALIVSPFKRVIVVDNEQRVKGIISDVDVLARMQEDMRPRLLTLLTSLAQNKPQRSASGPLHGHSANAQIAANIMNRDVVMVAETATIQETIERMIATRRKVLPVVDAKGRFMGIVGRSDLLRVLVEG
jgi:CBS domain-containing protein